jgi:hypothetical protein
MQLTPELLDLLRQDIYTDSPKYAARAARIRELLAADHPQPQLVVAVTDGGYWAKGEDLEDALAKVRQSGASGTQAAVIYIYTGPQAELDTITVDGGGSIVYPQTVTSNRVGRVKLPMKQV